MIFDDVFAGLIGLEGKFDNDPLDPGNWIGGRIGVGELKGTKFGISAASYPNLDIEALTIDQAKAIYLPDFWTPLHCDAMPAALACAMFDCAVNNGVSAATRLLQRALCMIPDGIIGPRTLSAIAKADPREITGDFLGDCAYRYTELAGFTHDGRGWLRRIVKTAIQCGRMLNEIHSLLE